jgi:hypothetical protein
MRRGQASYLVVPPILHEIQINARLELLLQSRRLTSSVTCNVRSLLDIGKSNDLHIRVCLKDRRETLKRGIQGAAKRGGSDQVDIGVAREALAQLATLLVAKVCEDGIRDDVVFGAEVVQALRLSA